MAGAKVVVLDHPALGHTTTRADGWFDMVVNGGGQTTLEMRKDGLLPVQRSIATPWRDYVVLDDVVMIAPAGPATPVRFGDVGTGMQVARGAVAVDSDGQRQPTLLFRPGTMASMRMPGGAMVPMNGMAQLRITEYTVGARGPNAMPAALPPSSAYTFAAEVTLDQAERAGATEVVLSKPAVLHVENFVRLPVGTAVPVGSYDRLKARWVPEPHGLVIAVTRIQAGLAELDIDGDGKADSDDALAKLGVDGMERAQLASLYKAGTTLMRSPIGHFSTWDCNMPWGPPDGAEPPQGSIRNADESPDCRSCQSGSIIEPESQVLGERIDLPGTGLSLNYRSDRSIGRKAAYTLDIPLSSSDIHPALRGMELEIGILGRHFSAHFDPEKNRRASWTWDGRDGYGRLLNRQARVTIRRGNTFAGVYTSGSRFGEPGTPLPTRVGARDPAGAPMTLPPLLEAGDRSPPVPAAELNPIANLSRLEITLMVGAEATVGTWDARGAALGGWTLDAHHTYEVEAGTLFLGTGRRRTVRSIGIEVLREIVRSQEVTAAFPQRSGVEARTALFAPDGTLYLKYRAVILKVSPEGRVTHFAGHGDYNRNPGGAATDAMIGDGAPAVAADLGDGGGIALGIDGALHVADVHHGRIRRIDPVSGVITTVAGATGNRCNFDDCGDGGPALRAAVAPLDLVAGPDGSFYFADRQARTLRRLAPDGIVTRVAGNGASCGADCPEAGNALAVPLNQPDCLVMTPDGAIYFREGGTKGSILRFTPHGRVELVAGSRNSLDKGYSGDGGPALVARFEENVCPRASDAQGNVYVTDNGVVRRLDTRKMVSTVAGDRTAKPSRPIERALSAYLAFPAGLAVAPNGRVHILAGGGARVLRLESPLPDLAPGTLAIAAEDASEVYLFSAAGRHERTIDPHTGASRLEFQYDKEDRLTAIRNADGLTVAIERNDAGAATAVVGAFGARNLLTVGADGWLTNVTQAGGAAYRMGYTKDLLTAFQTPRGQKHTFAYDDGGFLVRDEDPDGGVQSLARVLVNDGMSDGYDVTLTKASGAVWKYTGWPTWRGGWLRNVTDPNGARTSIVDVGAHFSVLYPDDSTWSGTREVDPRWGAAALFFEEASYWGVGPRNASTKPLSQVRTARAVTLKDESNLLAVRTFTETTSVNGRTSTSTFDGDRLTWLDRSPAGRTVATTVDRVGRVERRQVATLAPVALTRDGKGQVTAITEGEGVAARVTRLSYGADGYLASVTNALGEVTAIARDASGKAISIKSPDDRLTALAWEAGSDLVGVTPPGRPQHRFTYGFHDGTTSYTPPEVPGGGPTSYTYDKDRRVTRELRPGAVLVEASYDAGGRPFAYSHGGQRSAFSYDPKLFRLSAASSEKGGSVAYSYTDALPSVATRETWSGPWGATLGRGYDGNLWLTSLDVNGQDAIARAHDADGLVRTAGLLTIGRAANGAPTDIRLGSTITETREYDSFGALAGQVVSAGGRELSRVTWKRDELHRIIEVSETASGPPVITQYGYDRAGRLSRVSRAGVPIASYSYDDNGNRLNDGARYDAQDRLLEMGAARFTYAPNGELATRTDAAGTTTYDYAADGSLRSVKLPGGETIEYVIDPFGRRIGKRVGGKLVQGFLYEAPLRIAAELDGGGAVVSRFVYALHVNVPDYMVKGGKTYRLVHDHLGSVRMVVGMDGTVAQRIDYDAWGNVVTDTSPGFQPFGFAGGLRDPQTSLTRFGLRDFDATSGRWTAKDPVRFGGKSVNLYAYAANDPINLYDPRGTSIIKKFGRIFRFFAIMKTLLTGEADKISTDLVRKDRMHEAAAEETRRLNRQKRMPGGKADPPDPFDPTLCSVPPGLFSSESLEKLWWAIADIDENGRIDEDDAAEWVNPTLMPYKTLQDQARRWKPYYVDPYEIN